MPKPKTSSKAKIVKTAKTGPVRLSATEVSTELARAPGWELKDGKIVRSYAFEDFYETIGFVNAVAYVANALNHHPDLEVGYAKCVVAFSTHDVGGLSKLDFESARAVDALGDIGGRRGPKS